MFKGITSYNQLNYAWRNGGRFYQGDFLHRSEPGYVSRDCCKDLLEQHFQQFINYERKKVHAQLALTNRIHQLFKTVLSSIDLKQNLDELTLAVGKKCSPFAFRVMYVMIKGFKCQPMLSKGWTVLGNLTGRTHEKLELAPFLF